MKFTYKVKHNGVYYPAGADVPIEETSGEGVKAPAVKVSGKVDEPKKVEEPKGRKYTEEDLDLPYMKLKSLASKNGIKVDKSAKAEEIKDLLRAL